MQFYNSGHPPPRGEGILMEKRTCPDFDPINLFELLSKHLKNLSFLKEEAESLSHPFLVVVIRLSAIML